MIVSLHVGQLITPVRHINAVMVSHWKYARECGRIGGGLLPGAEMRIAELSKTPGAMWVRAEIPGSDPVVSLKIAGEEYGANFRPIR